MTIQTLKGFNDILPDEMGAWGHMEHTLARVFRVYGYQPIRIPLLEDASLFTRSIGQETDIVEKEIYTLTDRGGRCLALRPEATASVVRAYLQHAMATPRGVKLFYHGPMFRGERPQSGRNRQFYQMGVEALGVYEPFLDAEMIELAHSCLSRLGLNNFEIVLNTVGCPHDKQAFCGLLREKLAPHRHDLCVSCQRRMDRNVLRVLDCKNPRCRSLMSTAPRIPDHICESCRVHFDAVGSSLTARKIPFRSDPFLVRGLDYYTKTVFEIIHTGLGAQNSVCAGGRYDSLVAELDGPPTGAIGFAFGLERLLLAATAEQIVWGAPQVPDVFAIGLGKHAYQMITIITHELRQADISVVMDYDERSLKAGLKQAHKTGARFCLICGDDEHQTNTVTVRCMARGLQETIPRDSLLAYLRDK